MVVETDAIPQPRAPLSRDRVLRAGIQLADEAGIEALTMRRLAKELGVEAMTLYYYVANKDEILKGMVDLVLGEMEPPGDGPDWKAELRRSAISSHRVLMRHQWAANRVLAGGSGDAGDGGAALEDLVHDARMGQMEAILGCLRRAGFSAEMTHHAYHALESHVMGFTLWLVGMALDAEKLPDLAAAFLKILPRDRFPAVTEHIETHMVPMTEYSGSEFEFGLDLILDGLERLLAQA